jgi:putative MATE family efflux protein
LASERTIVDTKTKILLEGPIGTTLLRLSLPNIAVMVAQASVGLIETYFIAELGTDALAGIAIVFPVFMVFQMVSAGAMGGGILSAVARALGSGRKAEADILVWHAVALALGLGVLTTLVMLPLGPKLYALMGGRNDSLAAAVLYGNLVFAGAILLWLFNSLAAVIRGTGNMLLPAAVVLGGAIVLIPLSPLLIFGIGPLPKLGILGGASAVLIYYAVGTAIFVVYLCAGKGILHPSLKIPALSWIKLRDILRVGAPASIVATTTNVTIGTATAFVGVFGPAAVAGYGTGARVEYLLVPLVFGLGAPLAAMVGTAVGAGAFKRAARVAWTGAMMAGVMTELIGLAAAIKPKLWLELYGNDPTMLDFGIRYLQIVGPFYGFFGFGLALYFASQGTGRLLWPLAAGLARLAVAAGGGAAAIHFAAGITGVYIALVAGMVVFCAINSFAVLSGVWLSHVRPRKTESQEAFAVAE